jgi:hypothetical protein
MKNRIRIDSALYGILFLAAAAFMTLANPGQAWSQSYVSRDRVAEFNAFMRQHPKASTELQRNPRLVYSSRWLDKHPEVARFLRGRPELRNTIATNPSRVFRSYDHYDRRPFDRFDPRDRPWGWQYR